LKRIVEMAKTFRENTKLKGILFGLLSLFILEFGTLAVITGFETVGILHLRPVPYYSLLAFNSIVAGSLGIAVIKRSKITKYLALMNILVAIFIFSGYGYFVWYRFSHGI
jgi:hypothetical protein